MKWSTSVALAVAPLAMAASNRLRNSYSASLHARAEAGRELDDRGVTIIEGNGNGKVGNGKGVNLNSGSGIIIIWANPGNNAETTSIAKQVTVTKTVTAGAGHATAVPVAGGGTTTISGGQTATIPATGASHTVKVGGPGGLVFQPDQLSVPVGDSVVFEFLSQNHTVTQSPFNTPCKAMEGGMDSGFLANPNNTVSPPPQVAMQVMATTPLWFYCKQKGHCGKGMVFSINPTAEKTQAMFQSMAISQNGTGEATPITGGTGPGGAAPAPPPPANAEQPKAPGTSGTPSPGTSEAPSPPAAGGEGAGGAGGAGGATPGQGTVGTDGSCTCVVACNAGGFPAAAQGAGAFGGFAGALPTTMAALR